MDTLHEQICSILRGNSSRGIDLLAAEIVGVVRRYDIELAITHGIAAGIANCEYLRKRQLNEPMFVLLGRDPAACRTLDAWVDARLDLIHNGLLPNANSEYAHVDRVRELCGAFAEYQPKSVGQRS